MPDIPSDTVDSGPFAETGPSAGHGEKSTDAASSSGASRRRPKPGERRLQILQALAGMLEQPGAERITTAALAARLDVSEAALYRHFASKAQMFEGLIDFIEQSIFTRVQQIMPAPLPDPAAAVRRPPLQAEARRGRRPASAPWCCSSEPAIRAWCASWWAMRWVGERPAAAAHEPVLRPHRIVAAAVPARARRRRPDPPLPRWMPRCVPPRSATCCVAGCSAIPARTSAARSVEHLDASLQLWLMPASARSLTPARGFPAHVPIALAGLCAGLVFHAK